MNLCIIPVPFHCDPKPKAVLAMNMLTEKVGPLPVWAYGALVFAALMGAALFFKQKSSQQSSTTMPTQPTVLTQIQPVLFSPLPSPPVTKPDGTKPDMSYYGGALR
jgi:hypothetical protein